MPNPRNFKLGSADYKFCINLLTANLSKSASSGLLKNSNTVLINSTSIEAGLLAVKSSVKRGLSFFASRGSILRKVVLSFISLINSQLLEVFST